jgi:hypothetical protein
MNKKTVKKIAHKIGLITAQKGLHNRMLRGEFISPARTILPLGFDCGLAGLRSGLALSIVSKPARLEVLVVAGVYSRIRDGS